MDLKQKLRAAFAASAVLPKARVVGMKLIADRLLVYVVSPTFSGKTALQSQCLVDKAMEKAGTLSPEDIRRVGLVLTLTPPMFRAMLKARKAKRLKAGQKRKEKEH